MRPYVKHCPVVMSDRQMFLYQRPNMAVLLRKQKTDHLTETRLTHFPCCVITIHEDKLLNSEMGGMSPIFLLNQF
jgi:hypothetical protein